jgi:hypothetical protein
MMQERYYSRTNRCDKSDEDDTNTICISQTCRVTVYSSYNDGTDHKQPVCERNVDLSMKQLACMFDLDMWEVAQLLK